ncbi:MAG: metallophosphoesterase [Bradyrhizobiaceae bacterium]|nr:MAG: metallophosphoesterase [Bradyrhizobiaceae bacterium]
MNSFTLAHLSDPHLGPMPPARLTELLGKRAIGYANWKRRRHMIHRRDVLAQLVADLHAQNPDHIAVTGDLVNVALPAEFTQARAWLESIGPVHDVSLVPGNHDTYARVARGQFALSWADYMRGDDATEVGFPYLRRRGPLALIGLTTAVPSAPFMATGRIGRAQLAALDSLLAKLKNEPLCRVVLVHHPLRSARGRWSARLTDSPALIDILTRHGVDLVLHGHDHRHATVWLQGQRSRFASIGVPSASASFGGHHQPAAYQLISITRKDDGTWNISRRVRGFGGTTDGIVELKNERLG